MFEHVAFASTEANGDCRSRTPGTDAGTDLFTDNEPPGTREPDGNRAGADGNRGTRLNGASVPDRASHMTHASEPVVADGVMHYADGRQEYTDEKLAELRALRKRKRQI